MATIIRSKKENKQYILIGTGFGAYHSESPNLFFGTLAPDRKSGNFPVVFVCNGDGKVGWLAATDAEVVSIDGMAPGQHLPSPF